VILEHVTRLMNRGHEIVVLNHGGPRDLSWFGDCEIDVKRANAAVSEPPFDVVVATGATTAYWATYAKAEEGSYYYFVQNMEHTFFRRGSAGYERHRGSYPVAKAKGMKVITISSWVADEMRDTWDIEPIAIIGNGVNANHFYPDSLPPDTEREDYVVVEGDNRNPSKDTEGYSWKVAAELGVEVHGYSALGHDYVHLMDYHVMQPSVEEMRQMYSGALFMIKASKSDARSCAPVEAMACGTPCVRAIDKGDDDLIDGYNCLRVPYNQDALLEAAVSLLKDRESLQELSDNCAEYTAEHLNWDSIITELENLYGI
jgi:glycosyltransferase involved in cell wall biosynthesis